MIALHRCGFMCHHPAPSRRYCLMAEFDGKVRRLYPPPLLLTQSTVGDLPPMSRLRLVVDNGRTTRVFRAHDSRHDETFRAWAVLPASEQESIRALIRLRCAAYLAEVSSRAAIALPDAGPTAALAAAFGSAIAAITCSVSRSIVGAGGATAGAARFLRIWS